MCVALFHLTIGQRGLSPEKKRLFVIDGSKALRAAIRKVFGAAPVQRCRAHKWRNVLERLPEEQRGQAQAALRAAWKLDAKQGQAQLAKLAEWYERDWPAAAAALREGAEECFTINRLGVPPSLWRCLATTNIIESPNAGVRLRTARTSTAAGTFSRDSQTPDSATYTLALQTPPPSWNAVTSIVRPDGAWSST